jgi:hypothetical protein
MDNNRSRAATLLGFAAAAGAFGVAAMMAAATAPTARADLSSDFYYDFIAPVDYDFTEGQTDFSTAFSEFGTNDVNDGLASLLSGVNNDFLAIPDSLAVGTVDLLTNESVDGALDFYVIPASDFTSATADAESDFAQSQGWLTDAWTALPGGSYAYAVDCVAIGSYFDVAAVQTLLEGALASF